MSVLGYPPWLVMWSIATLIFVLCKLATLHGISGKPSFKFLYVTTWPGMDAQAFLAEQRPAKPTQTEWCFAVSKLLFGLMLLYTAIWQVELPLVRGWLGMIGVVFTLHFGFFHVFSCAWRQIGVSAKPLMHWPILAQSLADFWGKRWNTAFRDLTHRFLFRPLVKSVGAKWAMVVGFFASGIVHDVVISIPAGGGYGFPTLYFTLQGFGLLAERAIPKLRSRWFTMFVLLAPAYGLFHPPFVLNVLVPFLDWLSAPTLEVRAT